MTDKIFLVPFATSGDKTPIPIPIQGSGVVSYTEGYGPKYSLDPNTDPSALNITRVSFNELLFDITQALGLIQQVGFPRFITSGDNGGSPFPYAINAYVRYTDNKVYRSLINTNTSTPGTDPTKWADISGGQNPFRNRDITGDSPQAITSDDMGGMVTVKMGTPAPLELDLPAVATVPAYVALTVKCNRNVNNTNTVTLKPNGSETFEDNANYVLDLPYAALTIYTDGVQWLVKGA